MQIARLNNNNNIHHLSKSDVDVFTAIRRQDISAVRKLLCSGIPVDFVNSRGHTLLMYACFFGDEEMVQMLLRRGADPRYRNKKNFKECVLKLAVRNPDVVRILMGTTAVHDINYVDKSGTSPLYRAVDLKFSIGEDGKVNESDVLRAVKSFSLMAERVCNVDGLTSCGTTPLMVSARSGSVLLVKEVLKFNPDIDICCKNGKKAVSYAGSSEVRKEIVRSKLRIIANETAILNKAVRDRK